jgi:ABC-type multidrug transport system permease subunit
MIVRHYFKRYATDKLGVGIYIFFPVILLTLFAVINNYALEGDDHLFKGYCLSASFNMIANMLIFQLMGSLLVIDFLYADLRENMRWRLLAAPMSPLRYALGNAVGAYSFSLISGVVIIAVSAFAFNAYLHNIWVLFTVLFLMALISQLFGVLMFLLCKQKRVANTLGVIFCWGMILLSGPFMGIDIGEGIFAVGSLIMPYAIALRAVIYSGEVTGTFNGVEYYGGMAEAWMNVGYLAIFAAFLFILTYFISRRRSF